MKGVCYAGAFFLRKTGCMVPAVAIITCISLTSFSAPALDTMATPRWVFFTDKPEQGTAVLSPRSLARRAAASFPRMAPGDRPVAKRYLVAVTQAGGKLRHSVSWINAGSFMLSTTQADAVRRLPFVRTISPVRSWHASRPAGLSKTRESLPMISTYGGAYRQLQVLQVPLARQYLVQRSKAGPGEGVLIGVFDNGFSLNHACFASLLSRNGVIADSDFVDNDGDVSPISGGFSPHGSHSLSLIAGLDPDPVHPFQGVAPGARFLLARTENDATESVVEEDNWAAAMVWAVDRIGVDIISSSLGYRNDFSNGNDIPFADMDGKTTIISMAADSAVQRGVIVVNAMGNEQGTLGDTSINAPADVEGVVSVGAIMLDTALIAPFSSTGPTADDRIKPDVVAPGVDIWGPRITAAVGTQSQYMNIGNGTSYSTPLIAGVCALIMQANPGTNADSVKRRLYESCRFVPGQTAMNNTYGRGVPDALSAVLSRDEIAISVCTDAGLPVPACIIADSAGSLLGTTDTFGLLLLASPISKVNRRFALTDPWGVQSTFLLDSGRNHASVVLHTTRSIIITTTDSTGRPVAGTDIGWLVRPSAPTPHANTAGPDGTYRFSYSSIGQDTLLVWASADDSLWSDTVRRTVDAPSCSVTVRVTASPASRFVLYPNVIRDRQARDRGIRIEFVDVNASQRQILMITVRNTAGSLVREMRHQVNARIPVKLAFDCRNGAGKPLAPGTYVLCLNYGARVQMRKFIIAAATN